MPNHISNRLTFQCSEDQAAKELAAIGEKDEDGKPGLIDFNMHLPYPGPFSQLAMKAVKSVSPMPPMKGSASKTSRM